MKCPTQHDPQNNACQKCPLKSPCSSSKLYNSDIEMLNNKEILIIMSGKGGVGKSTFTRNLAYQIQKEKRITVLDFDLKGPSLGRLFNIRKNIHPNSELESKEVINSESKEDINLISNSFYTTPLSLQEMTEKVNTDFVLIDSPPGITDEHLFLKNLCNEKLKNSVYVLIISTSDDLAISVIRRQLKFLNLLNLQVLGLIENMKYFKCQSCNHLNKTNFVSEKIENLGIEILGELDFKKEIAKNSDKGLISEEPFFEEIYKKIENKIKKQK